VVGVAIEHDLPGLDAVFLRVDALGGGGREGGREEARAERQE